MDLRLGLVSICLAITLWSYSAFCREQHFEQANPKNIFQLYRENLKQQIRVHEKMIRQLEDQLRAGVRIERNGSVFFRVTNTAKSLTGWGVGGSTVVALGSLPIALIEPEYYLASRPIRLAQSAFFVASLSAVFLLPVYGVLHFLDSTSNNVVELTAEEVLEIQAILDDARLAIKQMQQHL